MRDEVKLSESYRTVFKRLQVQLGFISDRDFVLFPCTFFLKGLLRNTLHQSSTHA